MAKRAPHKLAIIIPAYKAAFLPAALDSIAAQTCKDFTLYVGDDCSPEPIGSIVDRYQDRIDLVYKRFENNLGGRDLVAQWERCIAMSYDEPYIWLFSDDDVMEPNCVEELFRQIEQTKDAYNLYHFDVNIIDEEAHVIKELPAYPLVLGAYDYYKAKSEGRLRSYVVENVFSRRIYEQAGGFKNFDLAWGSDVATWCIFCGEKGMYKISDAKVCWRRSSENITPDKSRPISERKLMAECAFLEWSFSFFQNESDIYSTNRDIFIRKMLQYKKRLNRNCLWRAFSTFFRTQGHHRDRIFILFFVYSHRRLYNMLYPSQTTY